MNANDERIIGFDRALWQAAMEGRLDDFQAMMDDGYTGVYARGFVTASDDARVTATMSIAGFHFEDVRVRDLGPGFALTTYITVLRATVGDGRDISGRYASTSIWKTSEPEGRRALLYHAESRIP